MHRGLCTLHKEKKGVKILPFGVQQLVAVPLKGHPCTFFTPKRCILVPWNTKTYLKVYYEPFCGKKKKVQRCPLKDNDVLLSDKLLIKICAFFWVVRLLNLLIIIKYYFITQSLKTQIKYIIYIFFNMINDHLYLCCL